MKGLESSGTLLWNALLASLATKRPLFHSEADFQFSLAWEIQSAHPDHRVRLEWPVRGGARRAYVDLLVTSPTGHRTAIELKYWTKALSLVAEGDEHFDLPTHGAQDLGRYDFWKDVARLERLVADGIANAGVAIALTNEPAYWVAPQGRANDEAFRAHDGRDVAGTLAWSPDAGEGTTRGRTEPIELRGRYRTRWRTYSSVKGAKAGEFQYLLVQVAPSQPAAPGPAA